MRYKRSIFCLILSEITIFVVTCWCDHKIQVFCIRNILKTKRTSARKHTEHSLTHLIKTTCKIWSISCKVQFWVKTLLPFFLRSLQLSTDRTFCSYHGSVCLISRSEMAWTWVRSHKDSYFQTLNFFQSWRITILWYM